MIPQIIDFFPLSIHFIGKFYFSVNLFVFFFLNKIFCYWISFLYITFIYMSYHCACVLYSKQKMSNRRPKLLNLLADIEDLIWSVWKDFRGSLTPNLFSLLSYN